jgi:transcription initiation factor TFIIIB Brf1 subunit/transcription initiation factor TFIIB
LGCCKLNSCYDCGYYSTTIVNDYQHQRKPFEGHYAAKDEAKLLRRIMSQTGLTEAEVRDRKKYRVMLSETQKQNGWGSSNRPLKEAKKLLKSITKELKLAKEHPKVAEKFYDTLKEIRSGRGWRYSSLRSYDVSHEQICRL